MMQVSLPHIFMIIESWQYASAREVLFLFLIKAGWVNAVGGKKSGRNQRKLP